MVASCATFDLVDFGNSSAAIARNTPRQDEHECEDKTRQYTTKTRRAIIGIAATPKCLVGMREA